MRSVTDEPKKFEIGDLSAYIDGELDESTRRAVEAQLARDPEAVKRVAAYRVQDAALRRALAASQESDLVRAVLPRQPVSRASRLALRAAAALLCVAIGFGSGAIYMSERHAVPDGSAFAIQAAAGYSAYGSDFPDHRALTAAERSLLDRWLSERLGAAFASPDFSGTGFELIDGRLVTAGTVPAAQLVYRDAQGRLLAFYLKIDPSDRSIPIAAPGESRFNWIKQGDIRICYWADGDYRFALTGVFDRNQMLELAKQITPSV